MKHNGAAIKAQFLRRTVWTETELGNPVDGNQKLKHNGGSNKSTIFQSGIRRVKNPVTVSKRK